MNAGTGGRPLMDTRGSVLDPLGWGTIVPLDPRAHSGTKPWPQAGTTIATRFFGGLGLEGAAGWPYFAGLQTLWLNIGVSSGNLDAGVWGDRARVSGDPQYLGAAMQPSGFVTSAGGFACPAAGVAGIGVGQGLYPMGPETLQDWHWLAMACDNTTATFSNAALNSQVVLTFNIQNFVAYPIGFPPGGQGTAGTFFPLAWGLGWVDPAHP